MHKLFVSVAVFGLVAAFSAPAFAKTETIKGQLIDQGCYLKNKANAGVDHKMPADTKDCAIACAKGGQPVAVLTADGKVYTIAGGLAANKNAKLVAHMGETVEITGDTMDMKTSMMVTSDELKVVTK